MKPINESLRSDNVTFVPNVRNGSKADCPFLQAARREPTVCCRPLPASPLSAHHGHWTALIGFHNADDHPRFHPHTFRHMLVQQGYRRCRTPEQFKAWSQNFGHDDVLTTLRSYGRIDLQRQREILQSMGQDSIDEGRPLTRKDLMELLEMRQGGGTGAWS